MIPMANGTFESQLKAACSSSQVMPRFTSLSSQVRVAGRLSYAAERPTKP